MTFISTPSNFLPDFRSNLQQDLDRVEARLKKETISEVEFLTEISNHLISAGGKRIRPSFTITASLLGSDGLGSETGAGSETGSAEAVPVSEDIITGAVAVELVHLGSLYHDDVMDSAEMRRNVTSVNAEYGEHNAILAGDFLLARASILAADLGTRVSRLLAGTIARLCAGQILEHRDIHNLNRTPTAYMKAIEGKTASLLSAACEIGVIASEPIAEGEPIEASGTNSGEQLGEFGLAYGMAFQIIDDISDLMTDGENLGKPAGNDISEGNFTLPIIYALEEDKTQELREQLGSGNVEGAIEKARESQGLQKAVAEANKFIDKAQGSLAKVDPQLRGGLTTQAFGSALEHLTQRMEALT